MMQKHEIFMRRCFGLARLGAGAVSPNPMVGAVLVYEGRIIGEGWHQQYGQAHAEVNCLAGVLPADRPLIPFSTLYVSLEPCCFHGKTPPCTDLILRSGIRRVVVSCLDLTPRVSGQGVSLLEKAGVDVIQGVLQNEGENLCMIRNTFSTKNRPFILLKFAQSADGFIGFPDRKVWISNSFSNRYVHRWRAELDAILVGTRTALLDNPQLDNRHWFGKPPLRIVLDRRLALTSAHHLLRSAVKTLVVTEKASRPPVGLTTYLSLPFDENLLPALLQHLYCIPISSLMVEGGSRTLSGFLNGGWWDEAAIFTAPARLGSGVAAPVVLGEKMGQFSLNDDLLTMIRNTKPASLNFV